MHAPAPSTARGKIRSWGSRFCTSDNPTTPTASPMPRAVSMRANPAEPASSTADEKTGPRGATMPPPMRATPSPTITDRTTGLVPMNLHPSLTSLKASVRGATDRRRGALGRARVRLEMIRAEVRKVRTST